jgi:hypothetical protein
MENLKQCKSCNEFKELSEYYIKGGKYISCKCKKCTNSHRVISKRNEVNFLKALPTESHCEQCNQVKSIDEFNVVKSSCKIDSKCNSCKSKLKRCYTCKQDLPIENFGENISNKDGKMTICRDCKSKSDKEYRVKYSDKNKLRKKEYYTRVKNLDWYKEKSSKRVRDYKKEYTQQQSDTFRHMKAHLRKIILVYIKKQKNNIGVKPSTEDILGIDFDGFIKHIEKQFLFGMSWDNHGKWHIDHILPCSLSNGDTDTLLKLFNYQNLNPMWAFDNLSKNDTVPIISCLWESPFSEFNRK